MYRKLNLGISVNRDFEIIASCPGDNYLDLEKMGEKALFDSLVDYLRENYEEGIDFEISNECNWAYNKGCRYLGVKPELASELSEKFCSEFPPGFEETVMQYQSEYAQEYGYILRKTGYILKSDIESEIRIIADKLAEESDDNSPAVKFPEGYEDIKNREPDFYKELEDIFWEQYNWWE